MSLLDPPSERFSAKDALDFAEKMANFELQRIDRMHVRFLWFIGIAGAIVLAFLTLLGFIGYNNLRTLATEAAASQLHSEVTKQIGQKLSKENLPDIVHQEVRTYSAADLRKQVGEEINKDPLRQQILDVGKQEIARLDKTLFEQRTLSRDDAARITKAIDGDDLLDAQPYFFTGEPLSAEVYAYADEIKKALEDSQLVLSDYANADTTGGAGVAVYCREGSDCIAAHHLAAALAAGHVKAEVIAAPFATKAPAGKKDPVIVWVGPKYLR